MQNDVGIGCLSSINTSLQRSGFPAIDPGELSTPQGESFYLVSICFAQEGACGARMLVVEIRLNSDRAAGPGYAVFLQEGSAWRLRDASFNGNPEFPIVNVGPGEVRLAR